MGKASTRISQTRLLDYFSHILGKPRIRLNNLRNQSEIFWLFLDPNIDSILLIEFCLSDLFYTHCQVGKSFRWQEWLV